MSVLLEFRRDEQELQDAANVSEWGLFYHTVLIVPVRYLTDGIDIFGVSWATDRFDVDPDGNASKGDALVEHGWLHQPLIRFMTGIEFSVNECISSSFSRQDLAFGAGDIEYRSDGVSISVGGPSGTTAVVATLELTTAIQLFRQNISEWIQSTHPGLISRPMWSIWFPSTSNYAAPDTNA